MLIELGYSAILYYSYRHDNNQLQEVNKQFKNQQVIYQFHNFEYSRIFEYRFTARKLHTKSDHLKKFLSKQAVKLGKDFLKLVYEILLNTI